MRHILPFIAIALAAPVGAQQGRAPFTIQETGQTFATIDDAVQSVRMGTATILIAPGVYHQCTIQSGGHITFKAVQPGSAVFEGTACEDKAAFVLRGQGSVVDGIVFRKMAVGDGNGAGIRSEVGDLVVRNSMFLDSQEGILGGQPTGQTITIDHSTFSGLGQCDLTPSCSHSIYLANQGSVVIINSRFERGTGGHYVKLRVPNVDHRRQQFRRYARAQDQLHDRPARGRARNRHAEHVRAGAGQGEPFRDGRGLCRGEDVSVRGVKDRGQ